MKKIIVPGVVAGICMAIIGFFVNYIFGLIYPSFQNIYTNTTIFISMASFQSVLFWVYPLVLGLGLAYLWTLLKFKAKHIYKFAWIYFFIGALPAFFINAGSFNLPIMMVVSWTIMSYLNGLVGAFIFSKMIK